MRRWLGALACMVAGLGTGPAASGQTKPVLPAFDEAACHLPGLSPGIRPRLRCGTVSVPRNYHHPGEGVFKLAVVIVSSTHQTALPEPVVYISGGPGGPLTIYAGHQAQTPYAPGRDLILVDQRGTGQSEPDFCPDQDTAFLDAMLAIAANPDVDAMAMRRNVVMACRAEAVAHGIDLTDFGTTVTAADFDWVRQALGIDRWNVYGESYGTTVAMTLAALHPETVRSLVLDSVYPPDPRPMQSANTADALEAFFRYCAGDQDCAAGYPGLAATYREALTTLTRAPMSIEPRPGLRVSLTATLFEALVSRLIYYSPSYPGLPRLIAAVHDGDTEAPSRAFASALAALAAEAKRSTNLAVECRDRPHYRAGLPAAAAVIDRLQPYDVCNDWSDLGPSPVIPAGTAVPTLVLAGEFDPVTRPSQSQHVAEAIGSSAIWVEFPRVGHNVRAFSPCGAKIAWDFIAQPAQPPDTSCASRRPPIRFLPR